MGARMASLTMAGVVGLSMVANAQDGTQEVRGIITAAARANIVTDLVAPVASVPFLEGATFRKGDVVLAFDCSRYEAELKAAKAALNSAAVESKQKNYLFKHGATGRSELGLAQAQSARAAADVEAVQARMKSCTVTAPFNGRVATLSVHEAEIPQGGQVLLELIDDSRIEIELIVPSVWLRHVRNGSEFSFVVEETGETLRARVDRLGAAVDPVSQTVKLYAVFMEPSDFILAGMSGNATFDVPPGVASEPLTGALQ